MKLTKLIAALLCVLLCLPVIAACGQPSGPQDTTAAPQDTQPPEDTVAKDAYGREIIESTIPKDLTFPGTTITFFSRTDVEFINEIFNADNAADGDIISNALYERNATVEDQLKVTLANVPTAGSYKEMHNVISAANMSGDDEYQVCALHAGYSATGITSGLYLNLIGLPYLSFDMPWWNSDFNDKATLYDQLYFCVGDLSTTALTGTYITYVNKAMATEFNINVDDLYTTVLNGDWTYDKMLELTGSIYVDDGNGARDINDKFGMAINTGTVIDPFSVCFDSQLITINDNKLEVNVYNEKMVDIVEKVYYLVFEHPGSYCHTDRGYLQLARDVFGAGRSLMMVNKMLFSSTILKDTDFEKALLPFPKYNAEQENYKSFSHNDHTVFSIPKACQNVEATTATLELMNELSYKDVTPVIFEEALKIKYSADQISATMLDLVRDGISFDAGWIYSNALGNIAQNTVRELMKDKSKDLSSRYASLSTTLDTKLAELDTYLAGNQ